VDVVLQVVEVALLVVDLLVEEVAEVGLLEEEAEVEAAVEVPPGKLTTFLINKYRQL
jgi:hypothetical protein